MRQSHSSVFRESAKDVLSAVERRFRVPKQHEEITSRRCLQCVIMRDRLTPGHMKILAAYCGITVSDIA